MAARKKATRKNVVRRKFGSGKKATRKKAARKKVALSREQRLGAVYGESEAQDPEPTDEELLAERIAKYIKGEHLTKKDPVGWYGLDVNMMGDLVAITLHLYTQDIYRMDKFMRSNGYRLLNVHRVDFEFCQDGREFWWVKERSVR